MHKFLFNYESNGVPIANSHESKCLTFTSLLFMIPVIYGLINGSPVLYSVIIFVTSILSYNHWKNPTYSIARTADICYGTFTFCITFILGVSSVKMTLLFLFGVSLVVWCFMKSNNTYSDGYKYWYIYHMMFHMFSIICILITISAL